MYLDNEERVEIRRNRKEGEERIWPLGLVAKASDFESGDPGFESPRGHFFLHFFPPSLNRMSIFSTEECVYCTWCVRVPVYIYCIYIIIYTCTYHI